MSNRPWTYEENDRIVADYFAMLAEDIAGRPYNKAEHRRALLPLLNGRSEGSVEFKHQNISAVLKGLGEDWIPGYKPAFNFQTSLIDAVARWLAFNPAWLGRMPTPAPGLHETKPLWVGPAPTLSNRPPPQKLEQMLHVARKFDVAGRDERNRALGRAGEECVLAHERATLKAAGRADLARRVTWVSEEDGAGYDIAFRKKLYRTVEELQADLDMWLAKYNEQRPHSGRYCYGKTPMQTFRETLHIAVDKTIKACEPADSQNPILSAVR